MSTPDNTLPWLDKVYGSLETLAILVGITLNSLALRYFYKRKHQLSNLLFFFIAVNDLLILTTCLPSAISMLSDRRPMLFSYRGVCILAGFLFNIASRMSVFLIALLALARAVSLFFPFRVGHKKTSYLIPLGIYLVLNILLASLPLIFSSKMYYYLPMGAQCSWGINELSFVNDNYTAAWHTLTYTTIIVPWFIPAVIVLVSCAFSLNTLRKSGRKMRLMSAFYKAIPVRYEAGSSKVTTKSPTTSTRSTNHATMTIVIATVVYILFNMPCWIFNVVILLSLRNQDINNYFSLVAGVYITYFMGILSVALNSVSNSIVYFTRIEVLRHENTELFEGLVLWVRERLGDCRRTETPV